VFSLRGDEPDWQVVEWGRNFERCPHYAWAHLSGAEQESSSLIHALSKLSMRELRPSQRRSELIALQEQPAGPKNLSYLAPHGSATLGRIPGTLFGDITHWKRWSS
jgi:hypothetical protein